MRNEKRFFSVPLQMVMPNKMAEMFIKSDKPIYSSLESLYIRVKNNPFLMINTSNKIYRIFILLFAILSMCVIGGITFYSMDANRNILNTGQIDYEEFNKNKI